MPTGMRHFFRLAGESLRYQLATLIGEFVVLRSSIQSPPVEALVMISLITTELGFRPVSVPPGVPLIGSLARQPSLVPHAATGAAGSTIVSDQPWPSVWGYQSSE